MADGGEHVATHGGKSTEFYALRVANDPHFLPERYDPRQM
jgi:hypothetical protein